MTDFSGARVGTKHLDRDSNPRARPAVAISHERGDAGCPQSHALAIVQAHKQLRGAGFLGR
ncbi:hypothetical protein [Salinibacterium sp. ZJ454]|uniref:hypothetical protein n=1 Tax=Salinibacterium sp. ZJ454 TaxID=2708339 RepID=UPI00141E87F8|nr:hypothetical protein [Salinibacterium sp. ZJ454]